MKKRLIAVISIILALVIGVSFVGCASDDPKEKEPTPPDINAAITKLVTSDGFKGELSYAMSTKAKGEYKSEDNAFERRGAKVMYVNENGGTPITRIFDLQNGYLYYKNAELDGYVVNSWLPQGTLDYAMLMLENQLKNMQVESVGELFKYDSKTKTATAEFDEAERVNSLLAPIQSAYRNNDNLLKVINDYLKLYSPSKNNPYTLETILNLLIAYAKVNPNLTVGDAIAQANAFGFDVYGTLEKSGILARFGITLDSETKKVVEARKLSQAIAGFHDYITPRLDALTDYITSPDPSQAGEFPINVVELINAVFVDDVEVGDLNEKMTNLKNLTLAALTLITVKPMVDKYLGSSNGSLYKNEAYALIKNRVQFEKLEAQITVKFDDSGNIAGVSGAAYVRHDYDSTNAGSLILSDNKYSFEFELNITEYLTSPEQFDIQYSSVTRTPSRICALSYGDIDDVSVYLETCGKNVEVVTGEGLTYDSASHTLTVSKAYLTAAAASEDFNGFVICPITVDGEDVNIVVAVMPDDIEELPTIAKMFMAMVMGGVGYPDDGSDD
ncbi:MAG: hypothetical protein J1G01_05780 [Clostridiales bacterium]|nr:hypothetical protein [Clostridiales bacterium]